MSIHEGNESHSDPPSREIQNWADANQYQAEPQATATANHGVLPKVFLLHMQDDPLGVLAAQNAIYKGHVVRHLSEVTDDERRQALDDMMKTTLKSPLEAIKMHWVLEGVDRAFTHQHVRQRTANFGQESLRFAVVGDLIDATTLPPELHGTERTAGLDVALDTSFNDLINGTTFTYASQDERNRAVWDWVLMNIDAAYHYEVEHGLAAEEARGLLPHCTATRIHYQTDLRGLMKVMGERLCTQAQFHWRMVAALIKNAIATYTPDFSWLATAGVEYSMDTIYQTSIRRWEDENRWQFELLADSGIFRPVCYQTGKCMFQASADRGCTIRSRVEDLAAHNVPSSQWDAEWMGEAGMMVGDDLLKPIRIQEWLMDPGAARE